MISNTIVRAEKHVHKLPVFLLLSPYSAIRVLFVMSSKNENRRAIRNIGGGLSGCIFSCSSKRLNRTILVCGSSLTHLSGRCLFFS